MTETEATVPRPPSILVLAAVTSLAPLSLNIIVPSVPGLADHFAVDYATAQLTVTLFIIAMAIGQLVIGPLSDALGRRPTLFGGLAVFLAGTLLCAFAWSIEVLILGRFIEAAGGVAGVVLGRAIVRDIHGRDRSASALGYMTMAMVVAPMLAPGLGGLIHEHVGWRATFWFLLAVGIAGIFLIRARVAETNLGERRPARVGVLAGNIVTLLGLRAFLGYTLTMTFGSALFFTFLGAAPYVTIEVLGHSPSEYGIGFMSISIGYMAGNFASARLAPRYGARRMLLAGCAVGIVGVAILAGFVIADRFDIVTLFAPMMVITFSNGLLLPNAIASVVSVRPDLAGSASGLSGFIQFATASAATYVTALTQDGTAYPMVWQLAVVAVLALAAYFIAVSAQDEPR